MRTHQCAVNNNYDYGSQQSSNFRQMNPIHTPTPKKDIFMPFLKPVFPPIPNKYAPELYHNQAKEFPSEQVTIKVPANL